MDRAQYEHITRKAVAEAFEGAGASAHKNIFLDIKRAYGEHHRMHHSLRHIAEMVGEIEKFPLENRKAFLIAILFHDFKYDPSRYTPDNTKQSNEKESADICANYCRRYGIDETTRKRACALIRMTEKHEVSDGHKEAALFMDIDMAVLGAHISRYKEYAIGTAQEFLHVFAPAEYRAGRAQFLSGMMAREEIFKSPHYKLQEPAARENMRWEKENLSVLIPDRRTGHQLTML